MRPVKIVAYESNQTGQFEIYIRPFRASGATRPVSNGGGSQPRWRRTVKGGELELFYVSPDSRLMSVPIKMSSDGQDVAISQPRELFSVPVRSTVYGGTNFEYDVSADGQRFLVNTFVQRPTAPISLILDRRAPAR